jgi:hypothetical protein
VAAASSDDATVLARVRSHRVARPALLGVAAVVVVVQLWAATANLRQFARIGWDNARAPNPLVRDADLDPLAAFASTQALLRAGQTIPRDASYAIVVGKPVTDPGELKAAFRFWLEPRPYVADPAKADWVIAYRISSESTGVQYSREVGLAPDVNAVEVKR